MRSDDRLGRLSAKSAQNDFGLLPGRPASDSEPEYAWLFFTQFLNRSLVPILKFAGLVVFSAAKVSALSPRTADWTATPAGTRCSLRLYNIVGLSVGCGYAPCKVSSRNSFSFLTCAC